MYNVSIIIPHYNSPKKLKRLLDSIPNKDDIEVIVVDDRSDKELEFLDIIIENYSSKTIGFYINNRENKGAGTCRNIGLEKATGEWILFADADDYYVDDFYEKIKKYLKTNYDIVFFDPTSWDEYSKNRSDRHVPYSNIIKSNNDLYLRYKFVVPWSKLLNHKFIKQKKIKFDEVIASNDVMFSIKTGHYADSIKTSNETIYCVTKSKGTLTQNISLEVFRARLNVFVRMVIFVKENISRNNFKLFNYRGRQFLIDSLIYRFGFKEFIKTYKTLRKNKIQTFDFRLLNPFLIVKRTFWHIKITKNESKYKIK